MTRSQIRTYLDLHDLARMAGLSYGTVRHYRAAGRLPEPDVMLGLSPGWHAEGAITAWLEERAKMTRSRKMETET